MSNKTIKFTILLDEWTNKQLMRLKHDKHQSKGAFIRGLINQCATMTFSLQPTCADGQRCSCPQMHAYSPPAAAAQTPGIPPDPDTLPRAPTAYDPSLPVKNPNEPPNDPDLGSPPDKPPFPH